MSPDSKIWLITGMFHRISPTTRKHPPPRGAPRVPTIWDAAHKAEGPRACAVVSKPSNLDFFFWQGTSSGLGLALVRRVLARGDRVIATSRVRAAHEGRRQFAEALSSLVDEWRREDRLRLLELDVSAPFAEVQRQVEAAIAVWGRVDVLVNNAGTVGRAFGPSEELGCVRFFIFILFRLISLFVGNFENHFLFFYFLKSKD